MRWLTFDIENPWGYLDRIGFCLAESTHNSVSLLRYGSFTWGTAAKALTHKLLVENTEEVDFLVAHNCAFDTYHLGEVGIEVQKALLFDTMYAAHLDRPDLPKALGAMWRYLPNPTKPWKHETRKRPTFYNATDCVNTALIAPRLHKSLLEKGTLNLLLEGITPSLFVLDRMTKRGISIDHAKLREWTKELAAKLKVLRDMWATIYPTISPTAPRQVASLFFKRWGYPCAPSDLTPTGLFPGDQKTLQRLTLMGPRARAKHNITDATHTEATNAYTLYASIEQTAKLLSTYTDPDRFGHDGKLHPAYVSTAKDSGDLGAAPGRLSAKPAIQNWPTAARKTVVPSHKGWVIGGTDLSSVEKRVQAALAEDTDLIKALADGLDIHQANADAIQKSLWGIWSLDYIESLKLGPRGGILHPFEYKHRLTDAEDAEAGWLTVADRKRVKNFGFAYDYGSGPDTCGKTLGLSRPEAYASVAAIDGRWPLTAKWRKEVVDRAVSNLFLENGFGRRRYFHGVRSRDGKIRSHARSAALNFYPQSTVADMFWFMFPQAEEIIEQNGGHMLTQIHDEFVWEAPAEKAHALARTLEMYMGQVWPQVAPNFRVPASTKVGPNWGELIPLKDWLQAGGPCHNPGHDGRFLPPTERAA